jgi:hypothetical protein
VALGDSLTPGYYLLPLQGIGKMTRFSLPPIHVPVVLPLFASLSSVPDSVFARAI